MKFSTFSFHIKDCDNKNGKVPILSFHRKYDLQKNDKVQTSPFHGKNYHFKNGKVLTSSQDGKSYNYKQPKSQTTTPSKFVVVYNVTMFMSINQNNRPEVNTAYVNKSAIFKSCTHKTYNKVSMKSWFVQVNTCYKIY